MPPDRNTAQQHVRSDGRVEVAGPSTAATPQRHSPGNITKSNASAGMHIATARRGVRTSRRTASSSNLDGHSQAEVPWEGSNSDAIRSSSGIRPADRRRYSARRSGPTGGTPSVEQAVRPKAHIDIGAGLYAGTRDGHELCCSRAGNGGSVRGERSRKPPGCSEGHRRVGRVMADRVHARAAEGVRRRGRSCVVRRGGRRRLGVRRRSRMRREHRR